MNARQMYNLMKRTGSIYSDSYIQNKIRNDFGVVKRWNPVHPDETNGNCILYNRVERCYMNENFRIGRIISNRGESRFVWDDEAQTSLFDRSMECDVFSENELNRIQRAWAECNPRNNILHYHGGTSLYHRIGVLKDGDDDTSATVGFELETVLQTGVSGAIARRDDTIASSIDARLGHYAYDGSVSGVEFISHTFTWNKLLKCKDLMKAQFQEMSESGLVASEGAGLHIHIGRNAFTNDASFKKFYYLLNHENLQSVWESFARRRSTSYCTYRQISDGNIGALNRFIRSYRNSHSEAVNQEHSQTIEVRIFKSTLSADILYGTIEALINLIAFCNSDNNIFEFRKLFESEHAKKLIAFGIITTPNNVDVACVIGRTREQLQELINQAVAQCNFAEARQLMVELEEVLQGGE